MANDYRFIQGWTTKADLNDNGTALTDLTPQSDRYFAGVWIRPGNEADIIRPGRLIETPSGSKRAYGGYSFLWPMRNLSPKMTAYLRVQMLGSASTFSGKVTVQTFDRSDGTWKAFQAWAHWPDVGEEAEAVMGGWDNLKIRFVQAVIAPEE